MKFSKKILKIISLYLLFGVLIAFVISICGGYQNLIIGQTMGNMKLFEYLCLLGYAVLLWGPMIIFMLFFKYKLF